MSLFKPVPMPVDIMNEREFPEMALARQHAANLRELQAGWDETTRHLNAVRESYRQHSDARRFKAECDAVIAREDHPEVRRLLP